MRNTLTAMLLVLAVACGADSPVAPSPPPNVVTYVLRTLNGMPSDFGICDPSACYQIAADTIRLGSDSVATRTLVVRETSRADGSFKETSGNYKGGYFSLGTVIYLSTVSADALRGTANSDGLTLTNRYGDRSFYARITASTTY